MTRSVPEWIGKSDDDPIPPRVKLRVWEACGGVCALSGRKIRPGEAWQVDHRVALILGGQHREANLQIVLADAHKVKTAAEMAVKSKVARIAAKHAGTWAKSRARFPSRPFPKTRPPTP